LLIILVYLLIRLSLLTGQFPYRSSSTFSVSLSCFTRIQSYNIWSVLCSPVLQGHIRMSMILYLYRCDLILFVCYIRAGAKAPIALLPSGILCALVSRSSYCRRQMSPRPTRRERSKRREGELLMGDKEYPIILPKCRLPRNI
jgi:hypothetical protein